MSETRYTVILEVTDHVGEEWDDEERNCWPKRRTTIRTHTVETAREVHQILQAAAERAADYGDGISDAKVLAIHDENNTSLPTRIDYWACDADMEDDPEHDPTQVTP